jgi:hypothetical protein
VAGALRAGRPRRARRARARGARRAPGRLVGGVAPAGGAELADASDARKEDDAPHSDRDKGWPSAEADEAGDAAGAVADVDASFAPLVDPEVAAAAAKSEKRKITEADVKRAMSARGM